MEELTMIVEEHGIPVWTRVRLPPGPLFVVRRDPTKLGGFLITQADAGERSSPFNASAPLKLNKSNSPFDIIVYRNIFCLVYRWK